MTAADEFMNATVADMVADMTEHGIGESDDKWSLYRIPAVMKHKAGGTMITHVAFCGHTIAAMVSEHAIGWAVFLPIQDGTLDLLGKWRTSPEALEALGAVVKAVERLPAIEVAQTPIT